MQQIDGFLLVLSCMFEFLGWFKLFLSGKVEVGRGGHRSCFYITNG